MDRAAPPRADGDDRLRLPADAQARGSQGKKNVAQARHLNQAFPLSGAPSSSICLAHRIADVRIAVTASTSAANNICQSSARAVSVRYGSPQRL